MCKKRIVLVFCASVLFSGAAMAEVDDSGRLIVPQTSVAPVIDGELDDVWQNVGEESLLVTEIINATSAVPEDESDLSGTFKAMYDDDNFYFLIAVQDSVLDYEFSDWRGDSVEIFFDGDNSKGSAYDGINDNQIRINIDDVELADIGSSLPVDGTVFKVLLTDVGYNIEAAFPLAALQIVPENTFGFEVQLNDNDGGGGRETLIRWFSNDNNSWQDASLFGEAVLVPTPVPVDPGTEGLVAFYTLDGDLTDSSGNGLDGTMIGEPNFVEGIVGMALDFDGVDDVVELGKFDLNGQITLAAWIKADDFEINDARVISKANEWGGDDHWWMLSTISETSLRFRLKTDDGEDTATLISDPVLEAGVWAHVAVTWDGGMMQIYKDGAEVASQEKGGSVVAVDPNISVAIGSQPSDAFASDPARVVKFFDGLIDEAIIYERALSVSEVLYLAGARPAPTDPGTDGLIVLYALENDVLDDSGNELHGTIVGEPTFVEGQVGMALEFDGVDDRVAIADDPAFDAMSETFTIAAWIKLSAEGTTDRRPIMSKELEPDPDGRGWEFKVNNGQLAMQLYSPVEGEGKLTITGTTALDADQWYHVAGIYQADGLERFYINGQLDHEQELVTALQANASLGNIGAYIWSPTGYQRYFAGQIDEVLIYERVLSEPEVRYLVGNK